MQTPVNVSIFRHINSEMRNNINQN